MKERLEPVLIFIAATFYYSLLSAFRYTWLFGSGDSGDWLASAKVWFVPQPYGSPLYISVAKLVGLLPGNIEWNMTFWLSIIPTSLSIVLIYLAVKTLTNSIGLARVSALIMLGALVMTTQAIVIEEYTFVLVMFCAALYAYSRNKHNWTVLFLGLASAVHILAIPVVFIFFVAHYREWKYWIKKTPIYVITGILPYGLILYMMWADTPRWIAGSLSIDSILSYMGATTVIGRISIIDTPERLFMLACFSLVTFGLAIKPAFLLIKKDRTNPFYNALFLIACFAIWLYATSRDHTTYTYLIYAVPCVVILAAIGLQRGYGNRVAVGLIATMMILVNGVVYDVARIDDANPVATTLYNEAMSIPDGSYVVTARGGFHTFGLMYAISRSKDLELIFIDEVEKIEEKIEDAGAPVYMSVCYCPYILEAEMDGAYELEEYSKYFKKVVTAKSR